MIAVQGLTKDFGAVKAVKNISFQIDPGEIVAFLGPNGAGKTTTMRILTGFIPPTSGQCRIKDIPIDQDPIAIKRIIGYLPEDNPLYYDMKVYEYLDFIGEIRRISNPKARIQEVIGQCGLESVIGKEIGTLSRGYKQRVGVAQAIIHNPDILILDEPTEGLDPNQVVELRKLIRELGEEKTVMLSTHILSEAEATCKRVIIINRGELVADGAMDEINYISKGGEQISLEIIAEKSPEPVFEKIKEIKHLELTTHTGSRYFYNITADKDIRELLFKTAVKQKWTILDMHRRTASLEDVFRELTKE
ncbi:hypothetical protein BXT86_00190 [candidate division WOR-3 bacterium 4484_100]|uniref:ABC transporter domain-containing protein n=1 Tax=candidate division WOR-3 bacterium 4484_100 TaxID=1936077 RepID=A0A1V4QIS0_UNCW3|nr:MAG: hypothetical protein BXT86_00190 [candidate division WOR-3 bacterium 4484_100]